MGADGPAFFLSYLAEPPLGLGLPGCLFRGAKPAPVRCGLEDFFRLQLGADELRLPRCRPCIWFGLFNRPLSRG